LDRADLPRRNLPLALERIGLDALDHAGLGAGLGRGQGLSEDQQAARDRPRDLRPDLDLQDRMTVRRPGLGPAYRQQHRRRRDHRPHSIDSVALSKFSANLAMATGAVAS
jgi:hypothetical protein